MIRIGVVNIDTSHPLAFSEILLKGNRARYEAVYNDGFRKDDEVEAFMQKRGISKRCQTVEELADCVDIGFIQGCNWDKHLDYAEVFMKKGKPIFLDKPMVGCMRDIRRLEAMMRDGLHVVGSSSMRYAQEITDFMNKPVQERGEILNIMGTCGVDEFNYGIHVCEAICAMARHPVSVRFDGVGEKDGKKTESYTAVFADGTTATYLTTTGVWLPCCFLVTTSKGVFNLNIDSGRIYAQLLDRICDDLETGKSELAPVSEIIESIEMMLAGRLSRQRGGESVCLCDIPEDDPGFDGGAFEREYAAAASPIYLG